jgi:AraC family transcriptional regulator
MESVQKALWLLESRFKGEMSLDELSQVAGISRYHFAHVFARATGQSAMRYMRGRRLSEAARVLANGSPDILLRPCSSVPSIGSLSTRAIKRSCVIPALSMN